MGWVGYVARMGERKETHTCFRWERLKESDHLQGLGIDGMIKEAEF
jgi:hypothetical protein